METYMSLLKSYQGRDKVLRTLGYSAVFVSGAFKGKIFKDLNTIARQLSATRTVMRLFDDLPMLFITKNSFYSQEKDFISKALQVLGNLAIQIYFPFEKVAWLADNEVLSLESYAYWKAGIACWALFLVFGILRCLRRITLFRQKRAQLYKARKLELPDTPETSDAAIRKARREEGGEVLTLFKNAADLVMAVNWLPPGFLWADKIPPSKNAVFGIISSLIGTYLFVQQEKAAAKRE